MNFLNHCQQALVNLTASKLRSLLAVLGILVGTAAVVALISCGQLATEKALEQFKALVPICWLFLFIKRCPANPIVNPTR